MLTIQLQQAVGVFACKTFPVCFAFCQDGLHFLGGLVLALYAGDLQASGLHIQLNDIPFFHQGNGAPAAASGLT